MSVIVVDPNEKQPTHHVSLSDGVNTIGLIAVKPDGTPDITALRREPYPKSTLNSGGGEGALSTTKVPYGEVSRSEWFGGLGQLRADADRSKFLMGNSLWMMNNRAVLPAPKLFRSGLNTIFGESYPQPYSNRMLFAAGYGSGAVRLTDYNRMVAWRFTPTTTESMNGVSLDLSVIPSTTLGMVARVTLEIWSDNGTGTKPLAMLARSQVVNISAPEATVKFSLSCAVTSGTNYWMALRYGDPGGGYIPQDDVLPMYQPAYGANQFHFAYSNDAGANWSNVNGDPYNKTPYWEIIKDVWFSSGLFFEYKHSLYAVINQIGGSPQLFVNGDRGVATANAIINKVVDTTKSWGVDQFKGAYVKIIDGPGKGEAKHIFSNTSDTLSCDNFSTPITTNSVYIITFTGVWQQITGHGMTQPVKHVAVSNEETIYFAFGDAANIRRTRWYNNAGAWANAGWLDETTKADLIIFTWDQEKKSVLWRAVNGNKPYVARAVVPAWGTAITWETEIYIGDDAPIKALIYHDGKLIVRKESSMWGVLEGVPDILDIDMASRYSQENGINNMARYSPYLLFPFQNKMQRLLGQLAENLGPPTMEADYAGEVVAMSPTLGVVFVGIRAERDLSNISNASRVMVYKDGSWFPFCELPRGAELINLYYQRQDNGKDLLWILSSIGIHYIRVPREIDYKAVNLDTDLAAWRLAVNHYSSLAIGIFDMGNKILYKWWERLNYADNGFEYVAYWTTPQTAIYSLIYGFDNGPADFLTWLPKVTNNAVNIRHRSRRLGLLLTNIHNGTSVVEGNGAIEFEYDGFNLTYLARVDDADMWLIPVNASDYDHDLNGIQEDMTAAQKLAIIDAWSKDVTPIIMRSVDSQDDNKRVILGRQPKQYRRYQSELAGDPGQSKEGFYTSLVIYEVT